MSRHAHLQSAQLLMNRQAASYPFMQAQRQHRQILTSTDPNIRSQMCRFMTCETYKAGEWVFTQGSQALGVHVILEGAASVWANPIPANTTKGPNDGGCCFFVVR